MGNMGAEWVFTRDISKNPHPSCENSISTNVRKVGLMFSAWPAGGAVVTQKKKNTPLPQGEGGPAGVLKVERPV